jgi:hypothetical protein
MVPKAVCVGEKKCEKMELTGLVVYFRVKAFTKAI